MYLIISSFNCSFVCICLFICLFINLFVCFVCPLVVAQQAHSVRHVVLLADLEASCCSVSLCLYGGQTLNEGINWNKDSKNIYFLLQFFKILDFSNHFQFTSIINRSNLLSFQQDLWLVRLAPAYHSYTDESLCLVSDENANLGTAVRYEEIGESEHAPVCRRFLFVWISKHVVVCRL